MSYLLKSVGLTQYDSTYLFMAILLQFAMQLYYAIADITYLLISVDLTQNGRLHKPYLFMAILLQYAVQIFKIMINHILQKY